MEPLEAPSSLDLPPPNAGDPPPEEPTLPPSSEAPPAPTTTAQSPSPSSPAPPSQSQPQSSQHQRQPIAARTRSHTQLEQSPFAASASTPSSSTSAPSIQRSELTTSLPAAHPNHPRLPSLPSYTYASSPHFSQHFMSSSAPSPSFSQPFGGFPRSSVPVTEPSSSGSDAGSSSLTGAPRSSAGVPEQQQTNPNSQFKPPAPIVQTIGMIGSLGGPLRARASGLQLQQRISQTMDKCIPHLSTNPTLNAQIFILCIQSNMNRVTDWSSNIDLKFQTPGLSRPTSMPSQNASISASQNAQSLQQQWMSNQVKQSHGASFPSSSYKPHTKQQTSQQRPQSPQHQNSPPVTPSQLQASSSQQQQQQLQQQLQNISIPHHLQDFHSNKNQQTPRNHASIALRSSNQLGHSVLAQSGAASPVTEEAPEAGNQILRKRCIQELVAQMDPCEKLEPEVEEVLVEIVDDFVESIATAACSLAKHRKSTTLEAKDILLYVDRNWNMSLPGFGGDDIKLFKKPCTNDIHKERLAMIRKSMGMASEVGSTKPAAAAGGQTAVANSKAHPNKPPSAPAFTPPKGTLLS